MAEIIFKHMIKQRRLEKLWHTDSVGTSGYHIGESPDGRTISTCRRLLSDIDSSHRARQIAVEDFNKYNYIFCMDEENLSRLNAIKPKGSSAVVKLLGSYDPEGMLIVQDPYYDSLEGFNTNFQQITRALNAFLDNKEN